MINIKQADLTNGTQKAIALVALCIVFGILWFILPPLIVIFKNLWYLAALVVPMLFLLYNYQSVWDVFKRLSWNMTKKLISSDKLWYMYRYYYYMLDKIKSLNENVTNVGAIENNTQRTIAKLIADRNQFANEAVASEKKGLPQSVIRVLQSKVAINEKQIDTFTPRLDFTKAQKKSLEELYDAWSADTEILKSTLDAKAQEYELMKELNKANNSAKAFLSKDSNELRAYNESLKQIEASVNEWTANVENFQREVAPQLARMSVQSDLNAEEGAKLIEEYKQKRIALS